MRKLVAVAIGALIATAALSPSAALAKSVSAKDFKNLKSQVAALKKQVATLQAQTGPQGPAGPQGAAGATGAQGPQGAQGATPATFGELGYASANGKVPALQEILGGGIPTSEGHLPWEALPFKPNAAVKQSAPALGSATATCDAGQYASGGGGEITLGTGSLKASKPATMLLTTAWTATSSVGTDSVKAYVFCAQIFDSPL